MKTFRLLSFWPLLARTTSRLAHRDLPPSSITHPDQSVHPGLVYPAALPQPEPAPLSELCLDGQRPFRRRENFLAIALGMTCMATGFTWYQTAIAQRPHSRNLRAEQPRRGLALSLLLGQWPPSPSTKIGLFQALAPITRQVMPPPQSAKHWQSQLLLAQSSLPLPNLVTFEAPPELKGKIVRAAEMPSGQKAIALTFDDGPWPDTREILTILRQHEVKATFFWVGLHLQKHPDIAREVVADGHAIGNHTWSHAYTDIDALAVRAEIQNTGALITRLTQVRTFLFRPPGGFLDNGLADYAMRRGYTVVMWTTDSRDHGGVSAREMIDRILTEATPGGIVLLHDGGGPRLNTVQALPEIIEGLKARGYTLVTVPELLELHVQAMKSKPSALPPKVRQHLQKWQQQTQWSSQQVGTLIWCAQPAISPTGEADRENETPEDYALAASICR